MSNLPAGVTDDMIDGEGFFCTKCGEECDEFELDENERCPRCAEGVEGDDESL